MKIDSIHPNYINKNFSFKSYSKSGKTENYEYFSTTEFFRLDMNWNSFANFINEKYADIQNVNIICHACSNGEEAYSLALKLISLFGVKAEKFFPIIAKDIDENNIHFAKKGEFNFRYDELLRMENHCGLDLYKFIDVIKSRFGNYLQIKNFLKEKVIFKKANILNDFDNIPAANTVLLCRNFWPYMPAQNQIELAEKLSNKLDNSSIVQIGNFDIAAGVDKLLQNKGFKETYVKGLMKKVIL